MKTQLLILLSIILSIIMIMYARYFCPCNKDDKYLSNICVRYEIFGAQLNHLTTYILLGYFFPKNFIILQTIGILWELIEIYLDYNEEFAKHFGGCLKITKNNNKNIVGKNHNKYINPIDKLFGIKNSKIHTWHGSIAEIIVNLVGFAIGYYLYKFKIKTHIVLILVSLIIGVEIKNRINI